MAHDLRLAICVCCCLVGSGVSRPSNAQEFVDLGLLVAEDYPCTWPDGFPVVQIKHYRRIGPLSAYHVDILTLDGNTGTQIDVPPHSIPRPGSNLPHAGPLGAVYTDKVPAWQYCGEACVIDLRKLLDQAPNGVSPLVKASHVQAWEKAHRPVRFGDVVLLRSDYTNIYYAPFPAGRRFLADPVEGKTPAWPDPDPDCMDLLGRRGVKHVGVDSPSIGPRPNMAEPTHLAGLKHGQIFTEGATNLDKLPATGAFYCCLGPKHALGPYGEGRALAILPGPLASRLIESARTKRAVDLSVVLSQDLPVTWPGHGVGNHRHPYIKVNFAYAPALDLYHHTHMMDSHAGTSLVPPAYALPEEGFDNESYAEDVKEWLDEYESKYGPRGTSSVTTEQVPIEQTCGAARVIDVRHLVGTTGSDQWPASPVITLDDIRSYEREHGELNSGDIVIFYSGHTDKHFKPMPAGAALMADPLSGKSEGWPVPSADVIMDLAEKGIRCLATDGPTLGGVDPKQALMNYWALGSRGMVGVEFLTNVGAIPSDAYFLFAAIKIRGCHGGPGRAIALY
jgi:kynurenine formamidase